MSRVRLAAPVLALLIMAALAGPALAQRFGFSRSPRPAAYDGRFVLARLYYAFHPGWSYDWPDMEEHLGALLPLITAVPQHATPAENIFRMDDPELLKFPVAYLSEPGYWHPTDAEVAGLRTYIDKGGFLIVDDFHFPNEWAVFEQAMRRVLPHGQIDRLDLSHPVFNAFFAIRSLDVPYPGGLGQQGLMGEFYGIHEQNDPSRPLSVIINYNIDLGDYVEWSAEELYNPQSTNEAYKFMVNYVIYGLTR